MQADENRVRLECDGIRDAVLARGKIERFVLGNGFPQRFGVIGSAVTADA